MAYFSLFKSVPLANGENSGNNNGVCRYVRARSGYFISSGEITRLDIMAHLEFKIPSLNFEVVFCNGKSEHSKLQCQLLKKIERKLVLDLKFSNKKNDSFCQKIDLNLAFHFNHSQPTKASTMDNKHFTGKSNYTYFSSPNIFFSYDFLRFY